MVDVILRVVSDPNPGRSTLVDFSTPPLFWVAGFSAPAPRRRSNSVSSFQSDGSTDAALAWSDRELTITFGIDAGTGDMAAGLLQILGRTFRDPVWLEFRAGTTNPVFFRTRATTIDDVDDFGLVEPGVRQVRLVIPAAPMARGLPVTGTALVPNDPTDGGMRFTVADVKGDVPAPLRMDLNFGSPAETDYAERRLIASSTYGTFHHAAPSLSNATAGTTFSTPTDASAVGGSHVRASKTSAPAGSALAWVELSFANVMAGEYRLLVRARSSQPTAIGPLVESLGSSVPIRTGWRWLDLGVYRFPIGSRQTTAWSPSSTVTATWRGKLTPTTTATLTVDVDHAVLIPAPGADGSDGATLLAQGSEGPDLTIAYDWSRLTISGDDEQVYAPAVSGAASGAATVSGAGFPRVTPGVPNLISLARLTPVAGLPVDSKAAVTTVDWSYYPCYLTIRGD